MFDFLIRKIIKTKYGEPKLTEGYSKSHSNLLPPHSLVQRTVNYLETIRLTGKVKLLLEFISKVHRAGGIFEMGSSLQAEYNPIRARRRCKDKGDYSGYRYISGLVRYLCKYQSALQSRIF